MTQENASKDLRYKTNKIVGKEHIYVEISLNDECKNGHQDFAITADIFQAGKPKTDTYWLAGGCCHDEIAKGFPEFIPFIKLHLCDWEGIPMHAAADGWYFLRNGFNDTKPDSPDFVAEYCDYYRITEQQFHALNEARNQLQFAVLLKELGILAQWKEEAAKAIAQLEGLTGSKFLPDSIRSQYIPPTQAQLDEEAKRIAEGYYTPEAEAEREKQKVQVLLDKLAAERDKEIAKATTEYEVKKQVLLVGGAAALKNCIFYNHSNTVAFNWKGYESISQELIEKLIAEMQLPEGVKIENKTLTTV